MVRIGRDLKKSSGPTSLAKVDCPGRHPDGKEDEDSCSCIVGSTNAHA